MGRKTWRLRQALLLGMQMTEARIGVGQGCRLYQDRGIDLRRFVPLLVNEGCSLRRSLSIHALVRCSAPSTETRQSSRQNPSAKRSVASSNPGAPSSKMAKGVGRRSSKILLMRCFAEWSRLNEPHWNAAGPRRIVRTFRQNLPNVSGLALGPAAKSLPVRNLSDSFSSVQRQLRVSLG